ncbi:MAG: hypothetical protein Q4B26_00515 [Eubacteriales bacterium]|nr:hypothetical protein [Eubacteriales bacterium]
MIGNPKFKQEQQVKFTFESQEGVLKTYEGVVYVVDANGTSEQQEEPSYDIFALVEGEKILFKHIRESQVSERV